MYPGGSPNGYRRDGGHRDAGRPGRAVGRDEATAANRGEWGVPQQAPGQPSLPRARREQPER